MTVEEASADELLFEGNVYKCTQFKLNVYKYIQMYKYIQIQNSKFYSFWVVLRVTKFTSKKVVQDIINLLHGQGGRLKGSFF